MTEINLSKFLICLILQTKNQSTLQGVSETINKKISF
jgi:hypothetical protein